MLKFNLSLAFLAAISFASLHAKLNFSSVKFSYAKEFDIFGNKVVASNNESIAIANLDDKSIREVYKFDSEQAACAKVGISSNRIFINTQSGKFIGLDYDGKIVFDFQNHVSRSRMFCVGSSVIFTFTNQYVVCYSANGKLVWMNKHFYMNDHMLKNKIIVDDKYTYFLNKHGFAILDNRTGMKYFSFDKFKNISDFYVNNGVVYSHDPSSFLSFDLKSEKISSEKIFYSDEYFQKKFVSKFVSGDFEYSYDGKILKNMNNNKEYLIDIKHFEFFENKIFAYSAKNLVIIDGDDVVVEKIDFNIAKLFYKNGYIVISDNENIKWTKF